MVCGVDSPEVDISLNKEKPDMVCGVEGTKIDGSKLCTLDLVLQIIMREENRPQTTFQVYLITS